MNNFTEPVQNKLSEFGYQARMVSISHLHEIQEAVGRLIKNSALSRQLYENWHFYQRVNDNLPDAKTIIIVAISQPATHREEVVQVYRFPLSLPVAMK